MSCRDIQPFLHDYTEGSLPDDKRHMMNIHLQGCAHCWREHTELKNAIRISQQLDEIDPPPFLTSRIMAHVREESQARSGFLQWFMTPVRVPAGALAVVFIVLAASYVYQTMSPLEKKAKRPLISQAEHSRLPEHPAPSDKPPEALVSQQDVSSGQSAVSQRQTGDTADIDKLRSIEDERLADLEVTVAVENVPIGAQNVLRHVLQLKGTIVKAELLEKGYRITADMNATRKDDLIAEVNAIGEVEQGSYKWTTNPRLRVNIYITEKRK